MRPCSQSGVEYGTAVTNIPELSSYKWGKQDLSGSDAGRTMSLVMWKNLKGKTRTLDLEWRGVKASALAPLLQAFDHEYFKLTYRDALTNTCTGVFYAGDFEGELGHATLHGGVWERVSFNVIQAVPDT